MLSKEEIFEALTAWNYWQRPLPPTVSRQAYEREIAAKAGTGEIIILKGVRRSGKSTLLINEMKRLLGRGCPSRNILYVNFEDPRFLNHLDLELMELIRETYFEFMAPADKPFFFFDEIQNIPGWEKWILKEYATGAAHLYVTGSSSSLLSREIGTALSGRYFDIEVFPLSFQEFLMFHGMEINSRAELIGAKTEINRLLRRYIEQGGFPKLIELEDDGLRQDLLKNYFDLL